MRMLPGFRTLLSCVSVAWMSLAAPTPAQAQNDPGALTTALRELAEEIATYMKNDAQASELTLGAFTAAQPELAANFGTAIKKTLADELKKLQIDTKIRGPRFSCKGEFTFFSDGADSGKVTIDAVLREKEFKRKTFSKEIFNVSDVAALMGGTGKLSPDPEQRSEDLLTSIQDPKPEVKPSPAAPGNPQLIRVSAAKEADYAMEIWRLKPDRIAVPNPSDADYEPMPITKEDGLLFVELEQENRYAVRLVNNTQKLAAATLTIDGLNMFVFSTVPEYKNLGKVLVPPGPKGVLIKGWHHTNTESFAFEVSDVGEAAVSKFRDQGIEIEEEIGVITARFAVAVDVAKGETLPPDEPKAASLGTAKGPKVGQTYSDVQVKIGLDREVITIRYSHPLPQT